MSKNLRGLASKVDMEESIKKENIDKMSFKKAFKSECSGEYSNSNYQFLWRGKKFNCKQKKKK